MIAIEKLKFDEKGLIPAIIQDMENNEVLMMAYMNKESLQKTLETGRVWFWSRSRGKFWMKGETSSHTQTVASIYFDCDADALLIKVHQKGGACHEGFRSCFSWRLSDDGSSYEVVGRKVFNPDMVYR